MKIGMKLMVELAVKGLDVEMDKINDKIRKHEKIVNELYGDSMQYDLRKKHETRVNELSLQYNEIKTQKDDLEWNLECGTLEIE